MSGDIALIAMPDDADIARRVPISLESVGFTVQGDVQDARCCVVILSPEANHSSSFEQQLAYVHEHNLRIFPVIVRGDDWSAIPRTLIGTHIIDVRANYESRIARLVEFIRAYLER